MVDCTHRKRAVPDAYADRRRLVGSNGFEEDMKHRCLSALLLLTVGCSSWETTRRTVVEPVNQMVHRQYPAALAAMDVERIASFHSEPLRAQGAEDARDLLAAYTAVEHGECVIEAAEADGDEIVLPVTVRVDGLDVDGQRRTTFQRRTLVCGPAEGTEFGFQIVRAETHATEFWRRPDVLFREESAERGLAHRHRSAGVPDRNGDQQPYLPGSGLAVGDVDGDGYDDALFISGDGLSFFHNHEGTFVDETVDRGLVAPLGGELRCGVFGDIDNDGDADLFVGVLNAGNLLFENQGEGFYRLVSEGRSGLRSTGETTGACMADFDGDGFLDLYVVNGGNLLVKKPSPVFGAKNGEANDLFRNNGDGTFTDVSDDADVDDDGWALALAASDWNQDGAIDLIIGNDFGQDVMYANAGDGTFDDLTDDTGVILRGSTMGVATGDVNGDGHIDVFSTAMASNSAWMLDLPGFPAPAPWPVSVVLHGEVMRIMREMLHGNRFYLNRGDDTFEEISVSSGTRNAGWAWGGVFFDYDHDTRLDLYVVNGLISGQNPDDL